MSRINGFSILVAAGFVLAACQSGTVSLEEAKRLTADFQGATFTPPPKTIGDITKFLDQQPNVDLSGIKKARAVANKKRPKGLKGGDLVEFLFERGIAAGKIGMAKRYLADLREAETLTRGDSDEERREVVWELASAEARAGSLKNVLKFRTEGAALSGRGGRWVGYNATLASMQAIIGDLDAAEKTIDETEKYFLSLSFRLAEQRIGSSARVLRSKALIAFRKGNYKESESLHRESIAEFEGRTFQSRDFSNVSHSRLSIAKSLIKQGRLVEAEIEARRALFDVLDRFGRYSQRTTRPLLTLTRVLTTQGRFEEAEQLSRAALDILTKLEIPKYTATRNVARFLVGVQLAGRGKWKEALAEFEIANANLKDEPSIRKRIITNKPFWALALIINDRSEEALGVSGQRARRLIKQLGAKHQDAARARAIHAMALASSGKLKDSLAEFSAAMPIILTRSRQTSDEDSSASLQNMIVGMILDSYIGLLADIRGTEIETATGIDAAAEAFRIADIARSRSVQSALAASGARAAARDPDLADLVRREQDTRRQVSALFGLLAQSVSVPAGEQNKQAIFSLRKRIDDLRKARSALAQEIEARFPIYAELVNPKPATIDKAKSFMASNEALIATYVSKERTFIWAVPKNGKTVFSASTLGKDSIAAVVKDLRSALDPQAATLGDIPDFNIRLSNRLYRALLAPVKDGWEGSKSLLVVAHGPLGQLPFSTLVTERASLDKEAGALFSNYKDVPWLARSHAVTVLPSVASLGSLRALPPANPNRRPFAGFGDPYFSPQQAAEAANPKPVQVAALTSRGILKVRGLPVSLRAAPKTSGFDSADIGKLPRLPDTLDEVRSIALALNADLTRDVFSGARASESAVKSANLSGYKVITFATHGLVPGDLNGLHQPALALTAPSVSGHKDDDGLLTMGEILSLRLDADWVVLSACNTASGDGAGAEAFTGLGRAFFYAGTRAMLLSNWPVETTSAKLLTTDIFKRQADDPSLTRAEAMRLAMTALIDGDGFKDLTSGKVVFSYAHPIFWAPFSLVGDGGGGKSAI